MKHVQPRLDHLGAYPFERLKTLLTGARANPDLTPIDAGAGEPRLPIPAYVRETLGAHLDGFSKYPPSRGTPLLRTAISEWLMRRYGLSSVNPERQVLTANGTREALFAVAHALVNPEACHPKPSVLMPNPMYQIYPGAAITAGAEPYFMPCIEGNGFAPDPDAVPRDIWRRTAFIYVCSPSNPTGWVADAAYYEKLLALADTYDFYIVADECYSEIYRDVPPIGLLAVCQQSGRTDFLRCLVMNSLSKRSALPGMRSGFIAGDADLIARFAKWRSYTGSATPLPLQHVAAAAWSDEIHVQQHRHVYRQSLAAFYDAYGEGTPPAGSFFVWLPVNDGETFAKHAFEQQAVTVFPGAYLAARDQDGLNPGSNYIRAALVDGPEKAAELAQRLKAARL